MAIKPVGALLELSCTLTSIFIFLCCFKEMGWYHTNHSELAFLSNTVCETFSVVLHLSPPRLPTAGKRCIVQMGHNFHNHSSTGGNGGSSQVRVFFCLNNATTRILTTELWLNAVCIFNDANGPPKGGSSRT